MKNNLLEENLIMLSLINQILKTNFLYDRHIKFTEVRYGENVKQYYRVYKGDDNKPTIFFIHGGGWWHGSPKMCSCIGKYFCKRGYTIVLPAYRLVPFYKYPSQIEDIFTALSLYITNSENTNENGIVVMGFSAGGELAANLVYNKKMQNKYSIDNSIFKCLVTLAGVLDFKKCKSKHSKSLINNYLGKEQTIEDVNPVNLITKTGIIDALCLHGSNDTLIDKENSISIVNKVNEMGGYGELLILNGKYHSDIIKLIIGEGEKESNELLDFIKKYENKN